jgi:hypothetical protein
MGRFAVMCWGFPLFKLKLDCCFYCVKLTFLLGHLIGYKISAFSPTCACSCCQRTYDTKLEAL